MMLSISQKQIGMEISGKVKVANVLIIKKPKMTAEELKAKQKAYNEAHKEELKAKKKAAQTPDALISRLILKGTPPFEVIEVALSYLRDENDEISYTDYMRVKEMMM